jgi:hypothetical protein
LDELSIAPKALSSRSGFALSRERLESHEFAKAADELRALVTESKNWFLPKLKIETSYEWEAV